MAFKRYTGQEIFEMSRKIMLEERAKRGDQRSLPAWEQLSPEEQQSWNIISWKWDHILGEYEVQS